ncbi:MAG: bifunctional hydroxymethylpyrimidine kinase/phosphomethylpyrimidine kinase [Rhizobiales bacterium]|nr:bifunctional hydroxymethylpyrimidine kinase/phosphomethylpyrimidine kinase [Hyphomicrobiales bacterium]
MTAIAVTIAGSDPSGGAGIQADLKTFSALNVYGASIITALTAQNTHGVQGVHEIPPEFVETQIESVFSDLAIGAVKIGMVGIAETAEMIAEGLDRYEQRNVVLDPVMVATSGDQLIDDDAIEAVRDLLFPRAMLVTPNLAEAAYLLETRIAESDEEMADQAEALFEFGPRAVLIKGGHMVGQEEAVDIFYDGEEPARLGAELIATENTHGTGCTLSSAIAASLAHGFNLPRSVAHAKSYISEAIRHAEEIVVGSGHGPVHHFHAVWGYLPVLGVPASKTLDEDGDDPE